MALFAARDQKDDLLLMLRMWQRRHQMPYAEESGAVGPQKQDYHHHCRLWHRLLRPFLRASFP